MKFTETKKMKSLSEVVSPLQAVPITSLGPELQPVIQIVESPEKGILD